MKHFSPIFLVLILFLSINSFFAHPPSGLELEFDPIEHILTIVILHPVKDFSKHYIYKITVELNEKEIIRQEFKIQSNKEEQEAIYMIIDAKEGDKITVTAYCNISGKKKETLEIGLQENIETEE